MTTHFHGHDFHFRYTCTLQCSGYRRESGSQDLAHASCRQLDSGHTVLVCNTRPKLLLAETSVAWPDPNPGRELIHLACPDWTFGHSGISLPDLGIGHWTWIWATSRTPGKCFGSGQGWVCDHQIASHCASHHVLLNPIASHRTHAPSHQRTHASHSHFFKCGRQNSKDERANLLVFGDSV